MSKMKIIDLIAETQVSHIKETLYEAVDWAMCGIDEFEDLKGDNYNHVHNAIMIAVIEKLHKGLDED